MVCIKRSVKHKKTGRVVKILYIDFSNAEGQLNSAVSGESGRIMNSSKLLWLHVLLTCKNGDPIKKEGARVLTTFLPL